MFTSRVEYRLVLREDNADLRLSPKGYALGILPQNSYKKVLKKEKLLKEAFNWLAQNRIKPTKRINQKLIEYGTSPIKQTITLEELLRRPEIDFGKLVTLSESKPDLPANLTWHLEIEVKYKGYIDRSLHQIEKFVELEFMKIPPNLDFGKVAGLSNEVKEKLNKFRPISLGQAQRIPGITPAAIFALMVFLKNS
jgi:tRNA uridine 5-carboxymethylaminomethyl modification enzyme